MLENEIKELTAALKENSELLRQANAGREEALKSLQEQAKEGATTGTARRTRAAAKKDEPAAAEPAAAKADAPSWNPDISVEGTRALVAGYVGQDDNAEAKKARTENVKALFAHFGVDAFNPVATKPDAKSIEGDDNRRQAVFYITRFAEGLPVDFSAEYDFGADPLTQAVEPAAEEAAAEEEDFLA